MQSFRGFIASISDFFGIDRLLLGQERGDRLDGRDEIDNEILFHRRLRGSIVILSRASSMHARAGSPFTRTAQLPHWPDPQQYR